MTATIKSGLAMLRILESWGAGRVYGSLGTFLPSILQVLREKRHSLRYIQTRSEESAALAAAAEAGLSGRPSVCLASIEASPRLVSGLYEARAAQAPVLALIGVPHAGAVTCGGAQEINAGALFSDVSPHTRVAAGPEDLPRAADGALRWAMKAKGPAVVVLPDEITLADLEDRERSTAANYRQGSPLLDEPDLEAAVRLINASRRPVLLAGQGAREAGLELVSLSDYFSLPIILSGPAKGIIADDEENCLGPAALLGTKPANEALAAADLIIQVGSDFPYAGQFFAGGAKCVQIDINPARLGGRRRVQAAILGDAGEVLRHLIKIGRRKRRTKFLEACRENMKNWRAWLKSFENRHDTPLRVEPVFREINRLAESEAIFVAEAGPTLIQAARLLRLNGQGQRFLCPGSLSAAGYAVSGGIAAKLSCPDRQVFTLSGAAALTRSLGDIATQVEYDLQIINLVFSGPAGGHPKTDFAKAAEALGARGFTVSDPAQLPRAFDEAGRGGLPAVIDLHIENSPPFPAEAMILDETRHGREAVEAFRAKHELRNMPTLEQLFHSLPD